MVLFVIEKLNEKLVYLYSDLSHINEIILQMIVNVKTHINCQNLLQWSYKI